MSFIHKEMVEIRKRLQDRALRYNDHDAIGTELMGLCRDLDYAFDQLQTWTLLVEMYFNDEKMKSNKT